MASNLERCVINALMALSDAALQALKSAIEAMILLLEEELLVLAAKAIPLNVVKQTIEAQAVLVRAASDVFKNMMNLLPTKMDGPCISLSFVNQSLADRLAPVTDTLDSVENDLLVAASLVDLNAIARRSIQELIDSLNEITAGIDELLSIRNSPTPQVTP